MTTEPICDRALRLSALLEFHGRYGSETEADCNARKNKEREEAAIILVEMAAVIKKLGEG